MFISDFAVRIFIAEDLTLKGKSTILQSSVKSSRIIHPPPYDILHWFHQYNLR